MPLTLPEQGVYLTLGATSELEALATSQLVANRVPPGRSSDKTRPQSEIHPEQVAGLTHWRACCYNQPMMEATHSQVPAQWPDPLQKPTAAAVAALLTEFWQLLQPLPDLLQRQEHLLADHLTTRLRGVILEMMLALNGIQWPTGTRHLNGYLSASQRAALEKTLVAPTVSDESWIGRAVALVVIYRWYAPQLVEKFDLAYSQALETEVWTHLQQNIPDWPLSVTTD